MVLLLKTLSHGAKSHSYLYVNKTKHMFVDFREYLPRPLKSPDNVDKCKHFGTVDIKLCFEYYVNFVCKRAQQRLYFLLMFVDP